jgi:hypothetical protein
LDAWITVDIAKAELAGLALEQIVKLLRCIQVDCNPLGSLQVGVAGLEVRHFAPPKTVAITVAEGGAAVQFVATGDALLFRIRMQNAVACNVGRIDSLQTVYNTVGFGSTSPVRTVVCSRLATPGFDRA